MSACLPRYSLIAFAVAQGFTVAPVIAQTSESALPTVTVTAAPDITGKATTASVGGFSERPLIETPASISVITQQQMQDRSIRSTTAAVETDASVNDAYNAVGYAEQFSIRGFTLENETSFRKDGLSFSGASSVPLENKERVEILKGLSGLQAGVATPGGIISYVTKRPTDAPLRTITTEISERGTAYGAVDLGGLSDDKRFGYRINAATETINSYVKGADGNRNFVSGAFDWHLTDRALLQLDMDYQHKSQITAPGYQLLDGTTVPTHVDPTRLIGKEPWIAPVTDDVSNIGLKFNYKFNQDWNLSLSANRYRLLRDDHSAFPFGFSANGDYGIYDYKSDNEEHTILGTQALLNGKFSTGSVKHEIAIGLSFDRRRDRAGQCVYGMADDDCAGSVANGTSNIYNPVVSSSLVPPSTINSGPVFLQRKDNEWSAYTQDVMTLSDKLKVHAGLRYTELSRDQFDINDGSQTSSFDKSYLLPNVALVYSPTTSLSVYGSYSQGLQHGGTAPQGTENQLNQVNVILNPGRSNQVEVGLKQDISDRLSFTAAVFRIEVPLEYTDSTNTYVQSGKANHRGIELGLQGQATNNLLIGASLTALDAKQETPDDPTRDGKRNVNVPKLKSVAYLDYAVADVPGLNLNTTVTYAGSKAFDTQNETIVGGYTVVDAGARYAARIGKTPVRFNFTVYNVFNKFYWRDVTQDLGGYLFPGAPRTYKLSAQFDF